MARPAGAPQATVDLAVGDRLVRVSSLDRVLFPASGFTKADLLDYYVRVAPVLLPHIAGHPLTLHRFPEGVGGPHFYQTRCPPRPGWLRAQRMHVFRSGKDVEAAVVDDLAGLVWAVNLSTVELHPYLAPADRLAFPRAVVFDLDPGPPAGLREACAVALDTRLLVESVGLQCLAKTTGGKGMHVYVPVSGDHGYDTTKRFARSVASVLARAGRDRVVDRMAKSLRAGKVFVDWSQNDPGKSTVAPYSLRAGPVPSVSMPVTWDDVAAVAASGDTGFLRFGPADALTRIDAAGDLFAAALTLNQTLPEGL